MIREIHTVSEANVTIQKRHKALKGRFYKEEARK